LDECLLRSRTVPELSNVVGLDYVSFPLLWLRDLFFLLSFSFL